MSRRVTFSRLDPVVKPRPPGPRTIAMLRRKLELQNQIEAEVRRPLIPRRERVYLDRGRS